jgi:hypothetical protein
MKKNIFLIAFSICLFSCEDVLEVPLQDSIATGNFFRSQSDFDLALVGAYDPISNHQQGSGSGSYFRALMVMGRVGTDEMYATSQYDYQWLIANYQHTAFSRFIEGVWEWQYRGISRTNTILDRLPVALENGTDIPQAEVDRIMGEAHFLRGFYYFQLVRFYGGVPLVTNEVIDLSALSQVRASLADTYAQVISDFTKAEELLPVENENGRARKYAASAFLAKAYLQMAGEPLKDPSAAAKALEYTTKVINEGGFALLPNYQDCFDYTNEYHSEYIFDAEYTFCGNCEGGQVGTWSGAPQFEFTQSYTLVRVFEDFFNSYEPNDPRRAWNIVDDYRIIDEEGNTEPLGEPDDPEHNKSYFAYKWRHGLSRADRPAGFFEWQSPFNFPLTRYADVLLMHAEAIWRVNGSANAEAYEVINQVRRRGYGLPIDTPSDVDINSGNTADFAQAILDERKWELCYEGHRWHDLVRFGKLTEAVKSIDYSSNPEYPTGAANIQDHHILYPIPQTQIDVSRGELTQNPGY